MSKSKFIPLPDHPAMVKCYVCGKDKPTDTMLNVGSGLFRCKSHKQSTILKATTCTHHDNVSKKRWKIDVRITGVIEEC